MNAEQKKLFQEEIAHIHIKTQTQAQMSIEDYIKKIKESSRPDIIIRTIEEATGGPITTLKLDDPRIPFEWQMMHRPNSVHIISVIVTQEIEETQDKVFTLVGGEVYHYGAAEEIPNFPAGGIDKGESVEHAALREMCKEEMPVLKPEWVRSAECISIGKYNYNSVGGTTEQSLIVRLDATLPKGMKIEELNGHIGGLVKEGERIKSQVEEIVPSLEEKLCGNIDKLALSKVLGKFQDEKMNNIKNQLRIIQEGVSSFSKKYNISLK